MQEEREIKLRLNNVHDINQVSSTIQKYFNINFGKVSEDIDVYFDSSEHLYFDMNHGLRIRTNKQGQEIAYKALFYLPNRVENPWFVLEKELPLPVSGTSLVELFDLANVAYSQGHIKEKMSYQKVIEVMNDGGLEENIVVRKKRRSASNNNFNFFLDDVEGLGFFIEIEATNTYTPNEILIDFPFNYDLIRYGYPRLYAENILKYEIDGNFSEKFINSPDWNYFEGQKELVLKLLDETV